MWMYLLGWFIGIFIGAFFLIQPLIILCFSIPFTVKLRRMGALGINVAIHTRDLISFALLSLLFLGSTWIMQSFDHNLVIGYYIGLGFSFLLGVSKIFSTKTNMAEYIENKINYIHPDFLNVYTTNLINNEPQTKWLNKHIAFIESKRKISM